MATVVPLEEISPPDSPGTPEIKDDPFADKVEHVVETEIAVRDAQDDAQVKVSKASKLIMTAIFCLSMMVNGLDFNILGDASPYIALAFNSFEKINWISTSKLLAGIATLLLSSKALNFVDSKYCVIFSLGLMLLGEILAGVATSFGMLLLGRICAGFAASMILVTSTTVPGMIWSSKSRPLVISIVIACYGVMIKVGPLVSGAFLNESILKWRWCFYVQIPFLGFLLLATIFLYPRTGIIDQRPVLMVLKKSALPGLSQAGALVCIIMPLVAGGTSETYSFTGPSLILCYIAAPLLCITFIYLEYKNEEEDRYLPVQALCEDRSVALMGVLTFSSMFTIFGSMFYLPVMYQLVFGSSAMHAAVQMLPNAVAGTVATVIVGRIAERTGHFIPSCIFAAVMSIIGGALCSTLTAHTPFWKFYLFTALSGIGAGGTASIGTPFVLEKVSLKRYGAGAAFINLCLLLGAGAGVSSLGVVFANKLEPLIPELHALNPAISLDSTIWQNLITILFGSVAVRSILRDAIMKGIDLSCIIFAALGAISLVASIGLKWQKMYQYDVARDLRV